MLSIKDLFETKELDAVAMSAVRGGCHKYPHPPMKYPKPGNGHGYGYDYNKVDQSGNSGGLNQVGSNQNGFVIGDGFSGNIGSINVG